MYFKDTNVNTNITAATPERVFTLCKYVEKKKSISDKELRSMLEPEYAKSSNYYSIIRDVAIDLGLIDKSDFISLKVEPENIKTIEDMRKFINNNMDKYRFGIFYAITTEYYKLGQSIFKEFNNVGDSNNLFTEKTGITITAEAMRSWRFWATFLGFGYLDSMFVIPNAAVFINDLLHSSNLNKKEYISVDDVFDAIQPAAKIIIDNSKRLLNYGATSGLLTLEQMGIIETTAILDHDVWNMEKIDPNRSTVITNIKIKK